MNLINLMPHRQRRLQERRREFNIGLGLSVLAALLLVLLASATLEGLLMRQLARNQLLLAEAKSIKPQEDAVRRAQAEINELKARTATVQNLQLQRNVPVAVVAELARLVPTGMSLTSLRQSESGVAITGVALSSERVSDLLARLQHESPHFHRAEVVEMRSVPGLLRAGRAPVLGREANRAADGGDSTERLVEFTVTVEIRTENPEREPKP